MITLRKERLLRKKSIDCFICGDRNFIEEMYPQEGSLICEHCLMDSILEGDN